MISVLDLADEAKAEGWTFSEGDLHIQNLDFFMSFLSDKDYLVINNELGQEFFNLLKRYGGVTHGGQSKIGYSDLIVYGGITFYMPDEEQDLPDRITLVVPVDLDPRFLSKKAISKDGKILRKMLRGSLIFEK